MRKPVWAVLLLGCADPSPVAPEGAADAGADAQPSVACADGGAIPDLPVVTLPVGLEPAVPIPDCTGPYRCLWRASERCNPADDTCPSWAPFLDSGNDVGSGPCGCWGHLLFRNARDSLHVYCGFCEAPGPATVEGGQPCCDSVGDCGCYPQVCRSLGYERVIVRE